MDFVIDATGGGQPLTWLTIGALRRNLASMNSDIVFIETGAPWQNGYAESFHAQFRRAVLDCEVFETLRDAQHTARDYKQIFSDVPPHGSLGFKTPRAYAAWLLATGSSSA